MFDGAWCAMQTALRLLGVSDGRERGKVERHPWSAGKGYEERSDLVHEGREYRASQCNEQIFFTLTSAVDILILYNSLALYATL